MSRPIRRPGPIISVEADDDGLLTCPLCLERMLPKDAYLCLRRPHKGTWTAWCRDCTTHIADTYIRLQLQEHPEWATDILQP